MRETLVTDCEVGTKHGGTEFVAITAVTDKCVDQIFAFNRLLRIHISDINSNVILR
jgi:predicted protein tyrosine phosphatase